MIVYKAVNKINTKVYVGLTTHSLDSRIFNHRANAKRYKTPFYRAIRKYGFQSFDWYIIDTADSKEVLIGKEIYWIKALNSKAPNGYNLTSGGDGVFDPSEETKRRLSLSKMGNKNRLGIPHTEETKKKMGVAQRGEKNPNWGKKFPWRAEMNKQQDMKGKNNPMFGRRGSLAPGFGKVGCKNPNFGNHKKRPSTTGENHWFAKRKLLESVGRR